MSTQQTEALRLTEIARYCFRSEGMSDPPEQFESPTGEMVDYFDHVEIEKALLARITELESQLAQRFDAADMATSAAQGFRDGVAKDQQAMWRHIETAPKDGQAILVTDGMGCYCVEWDEEFDWWTVDDNKLGPFRLRGSAPTHWMKLPPAPPGPADQF